MGCARPAPPLRLELMPPETAAGPRALRESVAARARELGFDAFGIAPVEPELRAEYYRRWIADGRHGDMHWMARNNDRRLQPRNVLPHARAIAVVGLNYYQPDPPEPRGRIAKYALGKDYHNLMGRKLKQLCKTMRELGGEQKPYIDTGPVLEKPLAAHAGLGWQGKNTLLLNGEQGTWLFLGTVFTTLPLPHDTPKADRCGSCTRCIDACPTAAITAPYQLDAGRCLAYLTIEHHGPIPEQFRRPLGDRVFGCDECLDVCPWNKWAKITHEERFAPRPRPDLRDTLQWDEAAFRACFKGTPVARLGLRRWLRNAAVVLGNIGTPADLPPLRDLARSTDPLLAEHAQWAVREIEVRQPSA